MKKTVKAIGMTAAMAVMIPFSAYAATTSSDGASAQTGTAQIEAKVPAKAFHMGKQALDQSVLDLLKLDEAAVKAKLKEGKTLAEIATEQGVTRDALKQALTDANNKRLDEMKTAFADRLDSMIDAEGNAFPDREGGFGRMKGYIARDFAAAASVLGLTEDELKTELASGKSLADVAKEKNVDAQKLIVAQKEAITNAINQAVKDGKLTQAQADKQLANAADLAEKIVNDAHDGKGRGGHGGPRGGFGKQDEADSGSADAGNAQG